MDLLGLSISDTAIQITAVSGIIGTISTTVWGIIERRGKKRAQSITNNGSKIENADRVHNTIGNILISIDKAQDYRDKYFKWQLEFCYKNIEEFIKFVKFKKDAEPTKS